MTNHHTVFELAYKYVSMSDECQADCIREARYKAVKHMFGNFIIYMLVL